MEGAHGRNEDAAPTGISRREGLSCASHNFHHEMIAQRGWWFQRIWRRLEEKPLAHRKF
jgi:hypothetical protein